MIRRGAAFGINAGPFQVRADSGQYCRIISLDFPAVRPMRASEKHLPTSDRHFIAVITLADEVFSDMRRALSSSFCLTQASTEEQIKDLVDNPRIHGIVLDLETIGGGPADAIEVLQEIRRLRDDVMLVAITESTASELPFLASQAGADHFFLKPVESDQLRNLLQQTLEKRVLQFEGRWLLEQVESRSAFAGIIGG